MGVGTFLCLHRKTAISTDVGLNMLYEPHYAHFRLRNMRSVAIAMR
jgi:hypothetical protein